MRKPLLVLLSVAGLFTAATMVRADEITRTFTDDLGRNVSIPAKPKRIVTLHDIDLTIPLIELGVMPVGSHGRMGANGKPYLRSSAILTGIDFDNSDIAYIGSINADLEAIVALKPDLILTEPDRPTAIEKLERIAPTVAIDNTRNGAPHIYKVLAELTGTEQRLAILDRRYQAQIEALKASVDTGTITVSVFQPLNGKISVYHTYRALGRVLRDAGFRFPAIIDDIPQGDRIEISAERLPELDADIIFDPYRSDTGASPQAEIDMMEAVMPGFCSFLKACREGRYILLPREEAISNSYAALSLMISAVQSHLTARPATRD